MLYFEPNFLDEALVLLERFGARSRVLAGGTLLATALRADAADVDALVNVKRIRELSVVQLAESTLRVGALVTAHDLARDASVNAHAPLLAKAAATVGARQLRTMATIGGNVCAGHHASDLAVSLLACEARCTLSSSRDGSRSVDVGHLLRPAGNALAPHELLVAFELPSSGARTAYQKMSIRRAFEMALVSVAARLEFSGALVDGACIALGGVAPTPIRAAAAESVLAGKVLGEQLIGEAARLAAESDARPDDDLRASADYRRQLVVVLARQALADVLRQHRQATAA